jgi:hypothetical protein
MLAVEHAARCMRPGLVGMGGIGRMYLTSPLTCQ